MTLALWTLATTVGDRAGSVLFWGGALVVGVLGAALVIAILTVAAEFSGYIFLGGASVALIGYVVEGWGTLCFIGLGIVAFSIALWVFGDQL